MMITFFGGATVGVKKIFLDGAHWMLKHMKLHVAYENALVEIVDSLQLSRNILVAQLSLQSWKPFMKRWMRAVLMYLDAKVPSNVLDKTSKSADDILKRMRRIADKSIPRSAENVAVAIGDLCMILPPSAHAKSY